VAVIGIDVRFRMAGCHGMVHGLHAERTGKVEMSGPRARVVVFVVVAAWSRTWDREVTREIMPLSYQYLNGLLNSRCLRHDFQREST
jgi:hypothetical protein